MCVFLRFQQFAKNEFDNEEEAALMTQIQQQRHFYNTESFSEARSVEDRRLLRLMQHKEQGDVEERLDYKHMLSEGNNLIAVVYFVFFRTAIWFARKM